MGSTDLIAGVLLWKGEKKKKKKGKKGLIKFKGEKFPAVPQSKSAVTEALSSKQEMYVVIVGFYYYTLPLCSISLRFN